MADALNFLNRRPGQIDHAVFRLVDMHRFFIVLFPLNWYHKNSLPAAPLIIKRVRIDADLLRCLCHDVEAAGHIHRDLVEHAVVICCF